MTKRKKPPFPENWYGGELVCEQPNPIRSKGTKTDAELFAEWEELSAPVSYCLCWGVYCIHNPKDRPEKCDAIAKELGPKLMEMRVEKLEKLFVIQQATLDTQDATLTLLLRPWWKFW